MNESDLQPAPSQPPAKAGGRPPERQRLFTPIEKAGANGHKPQARLAPVQALISSSSKPPGHAPALPDTLETAPPERPSSLVPNKAIPFLQRVHAGSQPEVMERRVSAATRIIALGGLGIAAALVVAASIALRAPAPPQTADRQPAPLSAAQPLPPPALSASSVADALTALNAFIAATTHEARQALADSMMPASVASSGGGPLPALVGAHLQADRARAIQAGSQAVVLVPVIDGAGLPRTAALLHRDGGWRVDWRSVLTPESSPWDEFASGARPAPHLFRLLITREPGGPWSLARTSSPEATRHPVTIAPGSRAAAELTRALDAQNGRPLCADIYLTADASRSLNILDWTQDKWSL